MRSGRPGAAVAGAILLAAGLLVAAVAARAADPTFEITIREHRFDPVETRIPAGERVTIYVINADATAEEFESTELNIEKIIPGGAKTRVKVGPLDPGQYKIFGEFHEETAQGHIIAE